MYHENLKCQDCPFNGDCQKEGEEVLDCTDNIQEEEEDAYLI